MQSLQKTGSSEYGEVFIGTTGKKDLVMNVVRVVTGVKAEDCREDTLYTFLFDMCRKQTKGAPRSRIKDKNYDFAVELDKKGLSKRVCQIFAAQVDYVQMFLDAIASSGNYEGWPSECG